MLGGHPETFSWLPTFGTLSLLLSSLALLVTISPKDILLIATSQSQIAFIYNSSFYNLF